MKKAIDKYTVERVKELRSQSFAEKDIVEKLSEVYANKATLVKLLIVTPTESKKSKYRKALMILFCLFVLNFLLDVYLIGFDLKIDHDITAFYVFRILISVVGNLILPIMVFRFKPGYFIVAPLFSIHGLHLLYVDVDQYGNYTLPYLVIKFLLTAILSIFSVALLWKIFPNYLRTFGLIDISKFEFVEP